MRLGGGLSDRPTGGDDNRYENSAGSDTGSEVLFNHSVATDEIFLELSNGLSVGEVGKRGLNLLAVVLHVVVSEILSLAVDQIDALECGLGLGELGVVVHGVYGTR